LDLLQAQVATIRRLAVPSSSLGDETPQGLRLPIPSFYEVQRNEDVNREIGEADQKIGASAFDRFNQLMKEWAAIKTDAEGALR